MKRELEDDPPSPSIGHVLPAPPQLQATVNVNTINNYFSATPPVAAADARPAHLFPTNSERRHKTTVIKDRKACSVYISDACRDGTLRGSCYNTCINQWVDIGRFAPVNDSHMTAGKRDRFYDAYNGYQQAFKDNNKTDAEKWRAVVEALRNNMCNTCTTKKHLSPTEQACKIEWEAMKTRACARNGGCQYQDCPERGEEACGVLEADHGTNPKMRDEKGHAVCLSSYKWWPYHGGPAAMRDESRQIKQWICAFCHALEPTSTQGRRCRDPATMPAGRQGMHATQEEIKQYFARRHATIVYPKHQYVDVRKHAVGACAHCRRPVVKGQESGFDWDHRIEATKSKGGVFGPSGGVSGLVDNNIKAAALESVRALLDAEMDKCDLLCRNCHHRKTHGYPRREPVA
jgi:hypothetical protein